MNSLEIFQHDSVSTFRFVIHGDLCDAEVQRLEWAWQTAQSIIGSKDLVVDVTGIENADSRGIDLLSRMRESGARLTATLPPNSWDLLRSLGIQVAASGRKESRLRRYCMLFMRKHSAAPHG